MYHGQTRKASKGQIDAGNDFTVKGEGVDEDNRYGFNQSSRRVPSPKKQTKNTREKLNEKNDKYDIKLLYSTAFIPRFA